MWAMTPELAKIRPLTAMVVSAFLFPEGQVTLESSAPTYLELTESAR